ncbi:hypothetical protein RYX36_019817, partial [Vicia faba]
PQKHYICVSPVDLHSSVLLAKTLTILILDGCTKLGSVKGRKRLKFFLEKISVIGCTSLEEFAVSSDFIENSDLSIIDASIHYVEEPSRISPELNSGSATPVVSFPSLEGTAGDADTASFRLVKSEPCDDNLKKKNLKEASAGLVDSLDNAVVKQEFIHHSTIKTSNSTVSNSKLVDSTVIKFEPSHEGSQERSKTAESTATGQLIKGQPENCSRAKGVNVEKAYEEVSSNPELVPLVTVAFPIVGTATELTNHALKYSSGVTKKEVADDHDGCRLKLMNEPSDPRDSGEGCVSDEEKITLSADMLEEHHSNLLHLPFKRNRNISKNAQLHQYSGKAKMQKKIGDGKKVYEFTCKRELEKRISEILEHVSINDLLVLSFTYDGERLLDLDSIRRIISTFVEKDESTMYVEEPSRISPELNLGSATPVVSFPSLEGTAGDANTASFRLVKSEPCDDNLKKKNLKEASAGPVGSLDNAAVKQEFIHHSTIKTSNSTVSNSKLVDSTVIKSEPSQEGSQERSKTAESTATGQLIKGQLENCSHAKGVNVEKACEEVSSNPEHVPLVTVAFPIVGTAIELTNHALKYSSVVSKKEVVDDHDGCRLKLMNEPSDPRDSGEGCVSDEEKITLSADMLEEHHFNLLHLPFKRNRNISKNDQLHQYSGKAKMQKKIGDGKKVYEFTCKRELEKRISEILEHVSINDLLVLSFTYDGDRLLDLDSIRRIISTFVEKDESTMVIGGRR